MSEPQDVLARVRRALGRSKPLARPPIPPPIDEVVTRLVHTDFGLPELFARNAAAAGMEVELVYVDELQARLQEFLTAHGCRRIALPARSALLDPLGTLPALQQAGFDARAWDALTPDDLFDFDAGLTDVYAAVAETGSLVIRSAPEHGQTLSLVPPVHVAVLQPRDFVPDLLDLMEKLTREGTTSGVTLITGPSKTADIEMNVVIGVHGPLKVKVFVLQ